MVTSVKRTAAAAEPAAPQPVAADLPWLLEPLAQTLATQRSHALLLQGPSGVGQFEMALALAKAWLCETVAHDDLQRPHGLACGHCGSCHLVDERSHPDLRLIVPEALRAQAGLDDDAGSDADGEGGKKRKPSREIRVEQIRGAIDFSELTAGRAALKVLLVHPAEALNAVSANALLKTLEEPPGRMRFVLSTSAPQALLPTIRSRCQAVPLRPPPVVQALAWLHRRGVPQPEVLLAASGDQPLAAWELHQGGLTAAQWLALPERVRAGDASAFSGWPLPMLVDTLQKLCHDRLLIGLGLAARYFPQASGLKGGDVARLTAWGAALRRHARHAEHPWSAGLAIEALLIEAGEVDAVPVDSRGSKPLARPRAGAPIHSRP